MRQDRWEFVGQGSVVVSGARSVAFRGPACSAMFLLAGPVRWSSAAVAGAGGPPVAGEDPGGAFPGRGSAPRRGGLGSTPRVASSSRRPSSPASSRRSAPEYARLVFGESEVLGESDVLGEGGGPASGARAQPRRLDGSGARESIFTNRRRSIHVSPAFGDHRTSKRLRPGPSWRAGVIQTMRASTRRAPLARGVFSGIRPMASLRRSSGIVI